MGRRLNSPNRQSMDRSRLVNPNAVAIAPYLSGS